MEPDWLQTALTVIGSGVASYLAISLKVARLEVRVSKAEEEIERLRDWRHDEIAPMLTRHELDLSVLSRTQERNQR